MPNFLSALESFVKSTSNASTPQTDHDPTKRNRPACVRSAPAAGVDYELPENPNMQAGRATSHGSSSGPDLEIALAADGPARIDVSTDDIGDRDKDVHESEQMVVNPFEVQAGPGDIEDRRKQVIEGLFRGLKGFIRIIIIPGGEKISKTPRSNIFTCITIVPNSYRVLFETREDAKRGVEEVERVKRVWGRVREERPRRGYFLEVRVEAGGLSGEGSGVHVVDEKLKGGEGGVSGQGEAVRTSGNNAHVDDDEDGRVEDRDDERGFVKNVPVFVVHAREKVDLSGLFGKRGKVRVGSEEMRLRALLKTQQEQATNLAFDTIRNYVRFVKTQSAQGTPILTPRGGTPTRSMPGSMHMVGLKVEGVEGVEGLDTTKGTSTGTAASTNMHMGTSVGSGEGKKRKRTLVCGSVVNEPVVALVVNAMK
ncbi:hypothetical protein HK102_007128, partial [Quaeritorhiza haematococci]